MRLVGEPIYEVRHLAREASCSRGVRMYNRNALLFHLPRVRIVESSSPALAAAVAAPMRKLWPAKWLYGSPASQSIALICSVNLALVRGVLSANWKNGPSPVPR